MGYYEENTLHEDSFSKTVKSAKSLLRLRRKKPEAVPLEPFGIYEIPGDEIIEDNAFFEFVGKPGGERFNRFRDNLCLLHERLMVDAEE